jgi:hypothetical protein
MWVYGERIRTVDPAAALRRIARDWATAQALSPGITRHAAFVSAFVAMGELAQGLADAAFARQGFDDAGPCDDASLAVLCAMAAAIDASRAPDREPSGSHFGRTKGGPRGRLFHGRRQKWLGHLVRHARLVPGTCELRRRPDKTQSASHAAEAKVCRFTTRSRPEALF